MDNNVVNFPKNQQDEAEAQFEQKEAEAIQNMTAQEQEVYQEIKKRSEEIREHVASIAEQVDETIYNYGQDDKVDISAPLEALQSIFASLSHHLDQQVLPEVHQTHLKIRAELADSIYNHINEYIMQKKEKVYQHDVYIASAYAVSSFILQHRMMVLSQEVEQEFNNKNDE